MITGSRDWGDERKIYDVLDDLVLESAEHTHSTEERVRSKLVLVHGDCPTGADAIAHEWARHYRVPVARYPADWDTHGRAAGPKRNETMVKAGAHHCLAFIGPCTSPRCTRTDPHGSHGATGCADIAEDAGIPTRRWTAGLEEK